MNITITPQNILKPHHCKVLEKWGSDRCIDRELLNSNIETWEPINEYLPHLEQVEEIAPLVEYMGEKIERHALQYCTQGFKRLRDRFGAGGFSIEGINPMTGAESGYPRFRPVSPQSYFSKGKIKTAKYLSRKGSTVQDFYARIPLAIAEKISDRYNIPYTKTEGDYQGFWQWVKENALPIILCEGEGDAMSVLSRGYVAVGIPGHHMAFKKQSKEFKDELLWLLEGGSPVTIAFDRDEKPATIALVDKSRNKVARALERLGNEATIAKWESSQGKGPGDIEPHILDQAILSATAPQPLGEYLIKKALHNAWEGQIDHEVHSTLELQRLLLTLEGHICVVAPTGSGKTEALQVLTKNEDLSHFGVTPLRSLMWSMAGTLDFGVFNPDGATGFNREVDDRTAIVINSVSKLKPLREYNAYLDEFEQSLDSLYRGSLNRKKRSQKIQGFENFLQKSNKAIALSATALPKDLKKLEEVSGQRFTRIRFNPDHGHLKAPITIRQGNGEPKSQGTAKALQLMALQDDIQQGRSAIVSCDTARMTLEIGILAQNCGLPEEQCLLYSRDTLDDERVQAFRKAPDKGQWLSQQGIKLLAYSPIMVSGDSIKDPLGKVLFEKRYGFLEGNTISPSQVVQFLNRYRSSTPIAVVIPQKGRYVPIVRGRYKDKDRDIQALANFLGNVEIESYALQNDRFLALQYQNFSLAFQLWAQMDGHDVEIDEVIPAEIEKMDLSDRVNELKAAPIVKYGNLIPITSDRYRQLAAKPEPTISEAYAMKAYQVRKWHGLAWDAPLTAELVMTEKFGKGTMQFNNLLQVAIEGYAEALDKSDREDLGETQFLHDVPLRATRLELWRKFGVLEIIQYCLTNSYSMNDPTLRSWWDNLWRFKNVLFKYPKLLGFTLNAPKPGQDFYRPMTRAIGTLLEKLGFKTTSTRSRKDNLVRTYTVTAESITSQRERLSRYLEEEAIHPRSIGELGFFLLNMDQCPNPLEKSPKFREREEDPPPPGIN